MIHLHTHSSYSFRDGISHPKELAKLAKEAGQEALALTDHGGLHGLIAHARACADVEIKPLFGIEAYEALTTAAEPTPNKGRRYYHITLIAMNEVGWKNLVWLHNKAWLDGFHRVPRIDREWFKERNQGLICLSACLAGRVQDFVMQDKLEEAIAAAAEYQSIFGDRFYLEIMNGGFPEQIPVMKANRIISKHLGIIPVATNDIHYGTRDAGADGGAHHVFKSCFGMKDWWGTDQLYLKTYKQMAEMGLYDKEIYATHEVADRCDFDLLSIVQGIMPKFSKTRDEDDILIEKIEMALYNLSLQMPKNEWQKYVDRTSEELELLVMKGYCGYFLILEDIVSWARSKDIPVGPGRGSAGGSLIAFLLGITQVDPIKFDLLFSRFMTPGRNTLPDIDIDVSQTRRGEILGYIRQRYGSAYQIAAFQTFGARVGIKSICTAMGVNFQQTRSLEEALPEQVGDGLKIDGEIEWLLANNDEFKKRFEKLPEDTQDCLVQLDGIQQHLATHAAGIMLVDDSQVDVIPIVHRDGQLIEAWDMYDIDKLKFLKLDLLGLRTMDVIYEVCRDVGIAPLDIPLDDASTFSTLSEGDTLGLFQVERHGFTTMMKTLQPATIQHVIDSVALYRPGPLDSGMVASYLKRRHGEEKVEAFLPELEETLRYTYGVLLYQEQIMAMSKILAGYDDTEADDMRKAMGKKDPEVMAKQKDKFIQGMIDHGYDQALAERVFHDIEQFTRYAFNKSHSTAYGLISYWTAFLKTHFPAEFYARLLNSFDNKKDRMAPIITDLRSHGIQLLSPDINQSSDVCTVDDGAVRLGLVSVKGLGDTSRQMIMSERLISGPFESFDDFCMRLPSLPIDKKMALAAVGAFDWCEDRGWLIANAPSLNEAIRKITGKKGGKKVDDPGPIPDNKELARLEREILGFYVKYDPYDGLRRLAKANGTLCGIITKVKPYKDKKKKLMAFLDVETPDDGMASVVMFASIVEKQNIPKEGNVVQIWANFDNSRGRDSWIAQSISVIAESL